VAEVPPSDEWLSIDVDLSSFAGQILQVRFVMDAEVSAGRPQFSRWQIRRFAIY
jgi:hypothetical protein